LRPFLQFRGYFTGTSYNPFLQINPDSQKPIHVLGIPMWVSEEGEECVARTTVVAAKGGRVAAVFEDVDVAGHVEAVIEVVRQL
jgi:peroxiredoxin